MSCYRGIIDSRRLVGVLANASTRSKPIYAQLVLEPNLPPTLTIVTADKVTYGVSLTVPLAEVS
jgi:hypothetical protein